MQMTSWKRKYTNSLMKRSRITRNFVVGLNLWDRFQNLQQEKFCEENWGMLSNQNNVNRQNEDCRIRFQYSSMQNSDYQWLKIQISFDLEIYCTMYILFEENFHSGIGFCNTMLFSSDASEHMIAWCSLGFCV